MDNDDLADETTLIALAEDGIEDFPYSELELGDEVYEEAITVCLRGS
ncbi:hypothetical protein [Ornithinimicrobium faecis]|nr:hypothetical protein [Ornithinimicrobium sp. HY1745]